MLAPGFTNLPCQAAQGVSFRKNLCKDIPRQSGPLALELRACEWLHTKAQQGITTRECTICALQQGVTAHNITILCACAASALEGQHRCKDRQAYRQEFAPMSRLSFAALDIALFAESASMQTQHSLRV